MSEGKKLEEFMSRYLALAKKSKEQDRMIFNHVCIRVEDIDDAEKLLCDSFGLDSFIRPGIHHVMFATPDYDKCSATMAENNVGVIGSGELQQTRFKMFDTKNDLGLICEIADGEALTPDESLSSLRS